MRRQRFFFELTPWIIAAEDFGKKHQSRGTVNAALERNGFDPVETRKVQHEKLVIAGPVLPPETTLSAYYALCDQRHSGRRIL
jgi:hypothetical protein